MKQIFYIAVLTITLLSSCSTGNNDVHPQPSGNTTHDTRPYRSEDDDRRILMKTKNAASVAVSGANITVINGIDTLTGQTDSNGEKLFQIPYIGVWNVTITHPNYLPFYTSTSIEVPYTEETYTLVQE